MKKKKKGNIETHQSGDLTSNNKVFGSQYLNQNVLLKLLVIICLF